MNSGTWFEAAQLRAKQLAAAAGGRGTKCAVAGLVWVSDASFGGKNTSWHGVYGAYKACKLSGCSSRVHVISCNACNGMYKIVYACNGKHYTYYMILHEFHAITVWSVLLHARPFFHELHAFPCIFIHIHIFKKGGSCRLACNACK